MAGGRGANAPSGPQTGRQTGPQTGPQTVPHHERRADVAQVARDMLATGLVRGTAGNVSARLPTGLVAVTPTGVGYQQLGPAGIVVVDADGRPVHGNLRPTSELRLHLAVYRARPDVGGVVHTHSPMATTFAVLGEEVPAVHYVLARAGHRIRVAPYATYGSAELAEACVRTLAGDHAVLLANHGVVAAGATPRAALAVAEAVEEVAGLCWRARLIGTPSVLADDEMARVAALLAGYGQPSG